MVGDEEIKSVYAGDILVWPETDDAAKAILGYGWRIPTKEEWEELEKSCTWSWIALNGVQGYKVASKQAGNSNWIFLPTHLFDMAGNVIYKGEYMTSNLQLMFSKDGAENNFIYFIVSAGTPLHVISVIPRYLGQNIRPVNVANDGVDLGLSVRWASSNLNPNGLASHSYDFGEVFAWGETKPKTTHTLVNYKFYGSKDADGHINFTKYNEIDQITILK